jgi:hypothetical protein
MDRRYFYWAKKREIIPSVPVYSPMRLLLSLSSQGSEIVWRILGADTKLSKKNFGSHEREMLSLWKQAKRSACVEEHNGFLISRR